MKREWSEGAWVRWGWLVTTLTLGVGLILLSWANDRSARQATQALYWGQSRLITEGAFRDMFHGPGANPPQEDLDRLLAARKAEGLRYVALFDEQGHILRSAGQPSSASPTGPLDGSDEHGPSLVQIGSRIRMVFPRRSPEPPDSLHAPRFQPASATRNPAGMPSTPADPNSPEVESSPAVQFGPVIQSSRVAEVLPAGRIAPPGDTGLMTIADASPSGARNTASGSRPPQRRPGVVMEFEPLIATRLIQRSSRLLASGIAAAAVMMLAASVFWRLSTKYEQAQRHLEKERRLSILGEMSAVLAHEIRNPLASLKGHAQLLSEHLAAETPDRRKADLVVSEATRLEILTADLLDFARTGPLDLQPVDTRKLVRECADEVAPGGFRLDLEECPEHWQLDGKRIHGALTNVLRNAREASPLENPPEVRVSTWERHLLITVRDHGEGLPPGLEERIFDPFFTTRTSGTGLGLSVARRIAEMHGGALTAANHEQGGAIFELALPNGRG